MVLLWAGMLPMLLQASIESFHPPALAGCLAAASRETRFRVEEARNPFYLRGDFNGDGRVDYALVVKVTDTSAEAVLICGGGKQPVLLGGKADPAQAFSTVDGDRFVAPDWEVVTASEARELTRWSTNVPRPVRDQKGEAIAMVFEDAVELIYWDGKRYRHAPAQF